MTDEPTIRSFLAIDPPEEVLREIGRIQSRLKKMIRGDVRWVRPESIHLTLKFLGDISRDAVAGISAVAEKSAAAAAPLELVIQGAGVFPGMNRPRVIWLGINGDVDRLADFQKNLDLALQGIGFPREERPFRPHLTLGRIKDPQGLTGLAELLKQGEACVAGRYTASVLGLFKSDLTPRGAVYTRIAGYPFQGRGGA